MNSGLVLVHGIEDNLGNDKEEGKKEEEEEEDRIEGGGGGGVRYTSAAEL